MNKSSRNVASRFILVALAISVQSTEACSSFYRALEGHYAGVVDLSPTCLQYVNGNVSGLVSFSGIAWGSHYILTQYIDSVHMGQMVIVETGSMKIRALKAKWQMENGTTKNMTVRLLSVSPTIVCRDILLGQYFDCSQPQYTRFASLKEKDSGCLQQSSSLAGRT